MSQGDKSAYSDKQKRQAKHIIDSERESGKSKKEAKRIAWATINKQDGGGKKHSAKSTSKRKAKSKSSSSKKDSISKK